MSNRVIAKDLTDFDANSGGSSRLSAPRSDGVSVRDFMLFTWRHRRLAAICSVACGVLAAAAALVVTPQYEATVVLLPVSSRGESMGLGSIGSAVSSLSGLASLAGVSLNGNDQEKAESLATLESQVLTDQYIQQQDLLPILFSKEWDATDRRWKTTNPKKLPTLWKANQLFKTQIRTVVDDTKTGLVNLTIRWRDPNQAAQWANGLVRMTNDYLRQRAIDESERNIAYLNQEVTRTNIDEVKNAIYALMEAEIKKEMVARGREEFALRVIDPAVTPEKRVFPQRTLWALGGLLGGLFLGLLAAVLRETVEDERQKRRVEGQVPGHNP